MRERGWEVWRQDDNGQEYLMEVVDREDRAVALVREYTERGHKQTYWYVRERAPEEPAR